MLESFGETKASLNSSDKTTQNVTIWAESGSWENLGAGSATFEVCCAENGDTINPVVKPIHTKTAVEVWEQCASAMLAFLHGVPALLQYLP